MCEVALFRATSVKTAHMQGGMVDIAACCMRCDCSCGVALMEAGRAYGTWMVVMLSTTAVQVLAMARMVSALEIRSLGSQIVRSSASLLLRHCTALSLQR